MEQVYSIIIGSGIVGLNTAKMLCQSKRGEKIILISAENEHCATTQNQTWLQFGGLYLKDGSIPRISRLCSIHAPVLKDRFYLDPAFDLNGKINYKEAGIFSYYALSEANNVIDFYRKYTGFPSRLVTSDELDSLLCKDLINKDKHYVYVPDRPFDERLVLNDCLHSAKQNPLFKKLDVKQPIKLIKSAKSTNGFIVSTEFGEFDAKYTFLATGIGTKKILKELDIDGELQIRASKSLLLKTPSIFNPLPKLLADRNNHLSIVKQFKSDYNEVLLWGNGARYSEMDLFDERQKTLSKYEKDEFLAGFEKYPLLVDKLCNYTHDDTNYSICYKVEQFDIEIKNQQTNYEPLISSFDKKYPGLYAAISGKATLGLYTAEKLLTTAGIDLGGNNDSGKSDESPDNRGMWFD